MSASNVNGSSYILYREPSYHQKKIPRSYLSTEEAGKQSSRNGRPGWSRPTSLGRELDPKRRQSTVISSLATTDVYVSWPLLLCPRKDCCFCPFYYWLVYLFQVGKRERERGACRYRWCLFTTGCFRREKRKRKDRNKRKEEDRDPALEIVSLALQWPARQSNTCAWARGLQWRFNISCLPRPTSVHLLIPFPRHLLAGSLLLLDISMMMVWHMSRWIFLYSHVFSFFKLQSNSIRILICYYFIGDLIAKN